MSPDNRLGYLAGLMFCVLKALTAAIMAEKAGAVPVFWLATEDHDFEEINTVNLPAGDHLQKFTVNVPHREGAPVGSIAFTDEIAAATHQVAALFGESEISELLAASYRKGETFGTAFARFYTKIFSDLGIVFLKSARCGVAPDCPAGIPSGAGKIRRDQSGAAGAKQRT